MRLYSQDVEGGHTDQRSAAGRAAHQQSGEWVMGFLHAVKSLAGINIKCRFGLDVPLLRVPHRWCA